MGGPHRSPHRRGYPLHHRREVAQTRSELVPTPLPPHGTARLLHLWRHARLRMEPPEDDSRPLPGSFEATAFVWCCSHRKSVMLRDLATVTPGVASLSAASQFM